MKNPMLVSVHGGHSGEFCCHASDSLEAVVLKYIESGFSWVGITEHAPPPEDRFRYADEIEQGLNVNDLFQRFSRYMTECRRLQAVYSDRITVLVGFESESYTGYAKHTRDLVTAFRPDYLLGSVHHVDDRCFDYSKAEYDRAVNAVGGLDNLYSRYFDLQFEMINQLAPDVVAHFDLVRIFDPDYRERIQKPMIWQRIRRNLEAIRDNRLILDFNLRALAKGASEPYICQPILGLAKELGIRIAPGDDSHGTCDIGTFIRQGIDILAKAGISTHWPMPGNRSTTQDSDQ